MNRIMDAVVVGGGIAGCSLAKQLADLGWETMLLDRQVFPRHKACGEFLSPESLEMLSKLGLDSVMESLQPQLISKARLVFEHGDLIEVPLPGLAWGISRYKLDAALHEAIVQGGVVVRTGMTVISIKQHDDGYEVQMKQRGEVEVIQARTVYAAWGSHRHANIFVEPYPLDSNTSKQSYVGIKSHYAGMDSELVTELYFVKGGYVGISPVENGYSNVAALLDMEVVKGAGTTVPAILEAASRANPQLVERMKHAVPIEATQVSIAPVHLSLHPLAWHVIPHLGDAAVVIPPLCGDGMSIALRSSFLCCALANKYLRGEISRTFWQEEYTQAMNREFAGLIRRGRLAHTLCSMPSVTRWFPSAVRFCPPLGKVLVKATRLKSYNG
ncbi:flavin-dependent dehydrogenase [Paenibacillus sp. DS2015]|uniref:NAD(P)/FAD-dependent oxidoreductase n=1 Tax=Paenibacillus sp. DS2015 TaxID=3373917 RepID=UPI003D1F0E79